jgi:Type I restriction enzyme HindI endonuclease subunit-like, C-terminal
MPVIFNELSDIYKEALDQEKKRKELGFSTQFEFAVYEELQSIRNDDEAKSKTITKSIYEEIKEETNIVEWKTKKSSEKGISVIIYDILIKNKFPEDKISELVPKIIDLAKRNL